MIARRSVMAGLAGLAAAALAQPAVSTALAAQGMTVFVRPPAGIAAWLPGEVAKWAAVIKAANITVD